jgi:hypothetical protein
VAEGTSVTVTMIRPPSRWTEKTSGCFLPILLGSLSPVAASAHLEHVCVCKRGKVPRNSKHGLADCGEHSLTDNSAVGTIHASTLDAWVVILSAKCTQDFDRMATIQLILTPSVLWPCPSRSP